MWTDKKQLTWLILGYLVAIILGAFVAMIGTSVHRQWQPWILIACLLLVFAAAVMVRAWAGLPEMAAYAVGWFVVVQVLSLEGPGGDVVLPGQAVSYVWIIGGLVAIAGASFTPRKWFKEFGSGESAPKVS